MSSVFFSLVGGNFNFTREDYYCGATQENADVGWAVWKLVFCDFINWGEFVWDMLIFGRKYQSDAPNKSTHPFQFGDGVVQPSA